MAIIKGYANLMLSDEHSVAEYRPAMEATDRAFDRSTRIVQDLLLLARADAGQYAPSLTPVDLHSLLDQAAESVRRSYAPPIYFRIHANPTVRENSTGERPPVPEAPPAPTGAEPAEIGAEPAETGIAETQEARPGDALMAGDLPAASPPTVAKGSRSDSGSGRAPSRFKLRRYPGSRRSVAIRYKLYASRMRLRPHLTPKRPTIALCVQFGRPVMRDGLPAYGTALSVSGAACLGADAGGADISPGVAVSVLLPAARAPLLPTLGHMLGFLLREAGCRPGALPDPLRDGGIDVLLESPG